MSLAFIVGLGLLLRLPCVYFGFWVEDGLLRYPEAEKVKATFFIPWKTLQ